MDDHQLISPSVPETAPESPRQWRSLEERAETPEARLAAHDEFVPGAMDPADPPSASGLSRRTFLSLVGATAAVAATVGCDKKGRSQVVPYTRRPQEIVPGVANYYASTFSEGRRAYSVLVKTREGRPIHISGNDEHPGLKGKTSPRALADVLRLYDPDRLRAPRANGKEIPWAEAERMLGQTLSKAKAEGKGVLLLSGASSSPSRQVLLDQLKAALPTLEHLVWEPALGDGAEVGARLAYGQSLEVRPRLEKAQVVLSLASDFLSGDDPEAIAAFMAHRRLDEPSGKGMNRLYVLEGAMSLTGTNADVRLPVKPSRIADLAFALALELQSKGHAVPAGFTLSAGGPQVNDHLDPKIWKSLVEDLHRAGPEAVVLCGDTLPAEAHAAAHLLNSMLGSCCVELRPAKPLATRSEMETAVQGMAAGKYGAVLLWDVNPAYSYPKPAVWAEVFAKVPGRIWMGLLEDESSEGCTLVLPEHHWLEAWGDHADGRVLALQQPTVGALYDTRQGEDVLLAALRGLGASVPVDYHAFLQERWKKEVQPKGSPASFDTFFQAALHDGLVKEALPAPQGPKALHAEGLAQAQQSAGAVKASEGFELVLRPGTQVLDGRYGNSTWLQELPDPITKATWGNPLSVGASDAERLGLRDGDFVALEVAGATHKLAVILQPGQASGVLVLNLGYGRRAGSVARGVGFNAFPLQGDNASRILPGAKLAKGRGRMALPVTQGHHRMDGRDLARTWTLKEFAHHAEHPHKPHDLATLYPEQEFPDHKWGMAIDLSTCIGCSACVLACQSENNIPSVGPDQVAKGREMHWMRIDRYYEGEVDNPTVVHQPMLCQHCDHAPCENVCPVNATNHSPDGLNQMAYNRCVGTRYCANNCPYKVRRFNFLEFTADKVEPETLVYNPEVTVRPRGVMEKCTFCVQRIQDVKVRAKGENRSIQDGEVAPACAVACPSQAIVFGDLKDPNSEISRLAKAKRGYKVLEELGARPAVTYLADLKNPVMEKHHANDGAHHVG